MGGVGGGAAALAASVGLPSNHLAGNKMAVLTHWLILFNGYFDLDSLCK